MQKSWGAEERPREAASGRPSALVGRLTGGLGGRLLVPGCQRRLDYGPHFLATVKIAGQDRNVVGEPQRVGDSPDGETLFDD